MNELAKEYINDVYHGDLDFLDEAENVISWLSKHYYIISKDEDIEHLFDPEIFNETYK